MPDFYEPQVLLRLQKTELDILKDFMSLCERHGLEYFGIAGTGIGAVRHQGFIPWDDDIDVAMPRESFDQFLKLVSKDKDMREKYYILNNKTDSSYPMMTTRLCRRGTVFQEKAMQDLDCRFGIFLDLYVLDNVADQILAYKCQAWSAWFYSKLLVLSCMPKPFLFQKGWKAKLIWLICKGVHNGLRILHLKPALFRAHCEMVCRRYEKKKTRRMAFLPDTNPYWNVVDKEKLYPLRRMKFEDTELNFPNHIEEMLTNQYGDYMTIPSEGNRKTHYPYRLEFDQTRE